ncbi:MAG: phage shock envelope stress response protein PspM [Stackebrandtia sp.]
MNSRFPAVAAPQQLKRLRRRLRSARRWTVVAGLFGGVAATAVPYSGLGAFDAVWTGLFGASAMFSVMRWMDYRRMSKALPAESEQLALHGTAALAAEAQTIAGALAEKVRGKRVAASYRHSAAAGAHFRLEQAGRILVDLAPRLGDPAKDNLAELRHSEQSLRELAEQIRGVEKSVSLTAPQHRAALTAKKDAMTARLNAGVAAYEEAVAAAAQCVAEQAALDGVVVGQDVTLERLIDATQKLRGHAEAVGEMHDMHRPPPPPRLGRV